MTEELATIAIGKSIGCVEKVAASDDERGGENCMRIRVRMDVTRPLCRGRMVKMEEGKKRWVAFRYESTWLRASFDRPPRKTTIMVPGNLPRGREKPPNESRRNPTLAPSEPQASPHRHNQVLDSMQPDLETDMEVEQNPGNTDCTPPHKSTIDLFNDHLCEIDQAINYIPEKVNIEEQIPVLVHNFPSQLNAIKTPSAQIMQPDSMPRTPLGDISNGLTNPTGPKQAKLCEDIGRGWILALSGAMNCISWNYRGLRNQGTVQELAQLVREKDFSVLFLSETWMDEDRLEVLRCRTVIDECGFIDLGFQGFPFTWCNNRRGSATTWLRLDRFMATNEWVLRFHTPVVHHLDSVVSDHKPIWLNPKPIHGQRPQRRLFRFEDMWLDDPTCEPTITTAWVPQTRGSPMEQVQAKISQCNDKLKKWIRVQFGNVTKQLKEKSEQFHRAEESSAVGNGHDLVITIRKEVQELLIREEKMWRQRSRTSWLKEGDRNTRYFHSKASHRRRRNSLAVLRLENGDLITDSEQIGSQFVDYYQELFTVAPLEGVDAILKGIQPRVTNEMNMKLTCQFIELDVTTAMKQMAPLKAPGPNGMPPIFYQSYWHVVSEDMAAAVLSCLNSGKIPASLNHSYVTLIPKTKSPEKVTENRPISLCNVVYKLISKVLANRLKKVLPHVVSETQSAFVPGRMITDNVLIAFETLHHMHNQRSGKVVSMVLKLDISKAYDKVEWGFLKQVMIRMGFCDKWISLIMECISIVTYSLLINGEPTGHIIPTRGIRQEGKSDRGERILWCLSSSNHLVPFIFICAPSPTLQLEPKRISSLAFKMLLHVNEPPVFSGASKILPFGKNFALKTLKNRELIWHATRDGNFTVRNGYHLLLKDSRTSNPECSRQGEPDPVWKTIWAACVPAKVRTFLWKVCHESLPTKAGLFRRKVWQSSNELAALQKTSHHSYNSLVRQVMNLASPLPIETFAMTCCLLWNKHNQSRLQLPSAEYSTIWSCAQALLHEHISVTHTEKAVTPQHPYVKVVIRDQVELAIATLSQKLTATHSIEMTKALVAKRAILFAKEVGLTNVAFERDAENVICDLCSSEIMNSAYGLVIEDAKSMLLTFQGYSLSHTRRSGNMLAHALARRATQCQNCLVWMEDVPPDISNVLLHDYSSL
uniref:Reverse transcriptase domain-containing protein n=1 Tax=Fagus sylvatica TaxID=28930 RepID=A0A2N9I518_FAGSY